MPAIAHSSGMKYWLFALVFALCSQHAWAGDPNHPMFHYSGLKVPRFVSLKSAKVNWRVGPGTRYPIVWVFNRQGWPVEIVEEFGHWRKLRDVEGTTGWVHKNLLAGTRYGIVMEQQRPLYSAPDARSAVVMEAQPMVYGQILECNNTWCRLQIAEHKGWIRRDFMWGVYQDEVVED